MSVNYDIVQDAYAPDGMRWDADAEMYLPVQPAPDHEAEARSLRLLRRDLDAREAAARFRSLCLRVWTVALLIGWAWLLWAAREWGAR